MLKTHSLFQSINFRLAGQIPLQLTLKQTPVYCTFRKEKKTQKPLKPNKNRTTCYSRFILNIRKILTLSYYLHFQLQ